MKKKRRRRKRNKGLPDKLNRYKKRATITMSPYIYDKLQSYCNNNIKPDGGKMYRSEVIERALLDYLDGYDEEDVYVI